MSRRRFVRWSLYFLVFLIFVGLVMFGLYESGLVERWARDQIVQQLRLRTGARVELGALHAPALATRVDMIQPPPLPSLPPSFHIPHPLVFPLPAFPQFPLPYHFAFSLFPTPSTTYKYIYIHR